jgi:hypothetical protein
MYGNPAEEWQQLTEHYHKMWDEELNQLAEDFGNLTETAQQVLRNEMRNRGLRDPLAPAAASRSPFRSVASPVAPRSSSTVDPVFAGSQLSAFGSQEEDKSSHEYTWKTHLCACDTTKQAWQLSSALKRAGIESWVENASNGADIGCPRVLVAADQLDQAREVAARPIPPEVVEESQLEVPEFEPPQCPRCRAEDPVLESVDPANSWLCEACGKQWTDPAADADGAPEKPPR